MQITIKRIYEPFSTEDGWRVLIDRLWPRGLTHEEAHIDDWQKEFAPSTELRQWFHHEDTKWEEFRKRYFVELMTRQTDILDYYNSLKKYTLVTFLYAAHDESHNNAVVFLEFIKTRICPD